MMHQGWLFPTGDTLSAVHLLWWLADLTVKAFLLLGLAGGLVFLLRRASAAVRHGVWLSAMVGLLGLPLLSLWGPTWHVPLFPELQEAVIRAVQPSKARTPGDPAAMTRLPGSVAVDPATGSYRAFLEEGQGEAFSAEMRAAREAFWQQGTVHPITRRLREPLHLLGRTLQALIPPLPANGSWAVWVLALWAWGMILLLGRMALGAWSAHRLTRRATPLSDPTWNDILQSTRRQLGLKREVFLLESPSTSVPVTWGLRRPVILLPGIASSWPESTRRHVLLHELAHVRRFDCLTQSLGYLACTLFWFNPLVWMALRHVQEEQERACDDVVLRQGVMPSSYASMLLNMARGYRVVQGTPVGAAWMARPTRLEGRIHAVLKPHQDRAGVSPRARGMMVGGVVLIVGILAAFSPWSGTESARSTTEVWEADEGSATLATIASVSHTMQAPVEKKKAKPVEKVPSRFKKQGVAAHSPREIRSSDRLRIIEDRRAPKMHKPVVWDGSRMMPPPSVAVEPSVRSIEKKPRTRRERKAHVVAPVQPTIEVDVDLSALTVDLTRLALDEDRLEAELEAAMEAKEEEIEQAFDSFEEIDLEERLEALGEQIGEAVEAALAAEERYQVALVLLSTTEEEAILMDPVYLEALIRIAHEDPKGYAGQRALRLLEQSDHPQARKALEALCEDA